MIKDASSCVRDSVVVQPARTTLCRRKLAVPTTFADHAPRARFGWFDQFTSTFSESLSPNVASSEFLQALVGSSPQVTIVPCVACGSFADRGPTFDDGTAALRPDPQHFKQYSSFTAPGPKFDDCTAVLLSRAFTFDDRAAVLRPRASD